LAGEDPSNNADYHLIAPLFPSGLVHAVHAEISNARFGEANKLAEIAKRNNKPHGGSYRSYPSLAVRKLGGTKPQNISQLNSERGGVNYLLSSNPPKWKDREGWGITNGASVFKQFRNFEGVNTLVLQLCDLLAADRAKTMETRQKREQIEQVLGQALGDYGSYIGNHKKAGWTREIGTDDLALHLQIWLDPDRLEIPAKLEFAKQDETFHQAFEWKDWPDQVATDFAQWLNAILRDKGLPVGDVEVKHWAKQAVVLREAPVTIRRKALTSVEATRYE
jgi:CRISPR-associated protein Csy1